MGGSWFLLISYSEVFKVKTPVVIRTDLLPSDSWHMFQIPSNPFSYDKPITKWMNVCKSAVKTEMKRMFRIKIFHLN